MTQQIVDAFIGVIGIAFIAIGFADFSGLPNLDKFTLVWGGMCIGYIVTTYLNIKEEDDDQI
jgi:hypothetical protein